MGRQFDMMAQKLRRVQDVTKAWGSSPDLPKVGTQQHRINTELERARDLYLDINDKIKASNNPFEQERLLRHMNSVKKIAQERVAEQEKLNRAAAEEAAIFKELGLSGGTGAAAGIAVAAITAAVATVVKAVSESNEQERGVVPIAARVQGDYQRPGEEFTKYTLRMREAIVDIGAEMAFSGKEAIQLANSLVNVSGSMEGFKEGLAASRGLGTSPQTTLQLLGFARRFGGIGNSGDDEKLLRVVTRGLTESGMLPRGTEYIQSIVQTMQEYSSRVPSLQPDTIAAVMAEINKTGIPTLRGNGAMQVTSGITQMMDDQSEAMIAIQTEIIRRNPSMFAPAARRLGVDATHGTGAYDLALALKQEGLATSDGLLLAGQTIKNVRGGLSLEERLPVEAQLLRLPINMVGALEKSGFIQKLVSGGITPQQLSMASGAGAGPESPLDPSRVMRTPGMAAEHFWDSFGSVFTRMGAGVGSKISGITNDFADTMDNKATFTRGMLDIMGITRPYTSPSGPSRDHAGFVSSSQSGPGGASGDMGAGGTVNHKHDVTVHVNVSGPGGPAVEVAHSLVDMIGGILGQNIKDSAKSSGTKSGAQPLNWMAPPPDGSANADKYGPPNQ